MNNNRVSGLATLHNAAILLTVIAYFWVFHHVWESSGRELISLPWSYALAAVLGVFLASFGSVDSYGTFLHSIGWRRFGGSVIKANFQVSLIAFWSLLSTLPPKISQPVDFFLLHLLELVGQFLFLLILVSQLFFSVLSLLLLAIERV